MTWRVAVLCIAVAVGWPAHSGRGQSPRLATSDLAVVFTCNHNIQSMLENAIEKFLRERGFDVLNQARIQRERGVFIFDVLIFALDQQRRIIKFHALPPAKGRYGASLMSPPPTQRSADLEDAVLKLVSEQLGCEVRNVARGENQTGAEEAYDNHYRFIEELFQKAERLQGRPHL